MGRLLLLLLIIVAAVLLWKAFGPKTWQKKETAETAPPPKEIKGPDDDEDFLWNLEKNRFKERRAREEAAREEEDRLRRGRERRVEPPENAPDPDENAGETGGEPRG